MLRISPLLLVQSRPKAFQLTVGCSLEKKRKHNINLILKMKNIYKAGLYFSEESEKSSK